MLRPDYIGFKLTVFGLVITKMFLSECRWADAVMLSKTIGKVVWVGIPALLGNLTDAVLLVEKKMLRVA